MKYVNILHNFQSLANLFALISVSVIKRSLALTAETERGKKREFN